MGMLAVYGKHKNSKKFYGFNFKDGRLEANKIFITLFNDDEDTRKKLEDEVDFMNKHNRDYTFEIRKIQ